MHRAAPSDAEPLLPPESRQATSAAEERLQERHQVRNFAALAVYQIVMRSGWIFKTESIIMPAVLDLISGNAPWARQMLPLLNRLGQSVPPMLMARRVKVSPYKARTLTSTTLTMAACFLLLGLFWAALGDSGPHPWMAIVFLAFYGLFFAAMGVNQLVLSTTQGKLIAVRQRGRLLSISNVLGAISAVTCAFLLLPLWLHEDSIDVLAVFGFASGCFFLSALATLFLRESPDDYDQAPQTPWQHLVEAWRPIRTDPNFRQLAFVSSMYGVSLILFPHYQAVGRNQLDLPLSQLLWWLILQNLGVGCFSLLVGPVADRFGNRLVLRILMLGLCGAPVLSLILVWYGQNIAWAYNFVFVLVGLAPVTIKSLFNYTLEICPPAEHPRYLSSIGLCMAVPLLVMMPLGGWIENRNLDVLFIVGTGLMLCGWLATFWLTEPREKVVAETPLEEM